MNLISKWIKAIFTGHLIPIIIGNWRRLFKIKTDLYTERYLICCKCEYKEDSPIGEICGHCGCPLASKLRLEEEKCFMNKF